MDKVKDHDQNNRLNNYMEDIYCGNVTDHDVEPYHLVSPTVTLEDFMDLNPVV